MIDANERGLRVVAPMTIAGARALLEAGTAVLATRSGTIDVDLSAVEDVDSAALAVLLGWQRAVAGRGQIVVSGAPDSVRALADMYGVAELLPLS